MTERTPEQQENLDNLLRVAHAAPEDRLHMRAFREDADCGTAYCLAGWAAIDPYFTKRGFAFRFEGSSIIDIPHQQDHRTVADAMAEFFGVLPSEADALFYLSGHPGIDAHAIPKSEVVSRVQALVNHEPITRYRIES